MYLNYILRFLRDKESGFDVNNTYILALDGDVDFKPDSLKSLLKVMEKDHKDKKIAAVCGRVHPKGNTVSHQCYFTSIPSSALITTGTTP